MVVAKTRYESAHVGIYFTFVGTLGEVVGALATEGIPGNDVLSTGYDPDLSVYYALVKR